MEAGTALRDTGTDRGSPPFREVLLAVFVLSLLLILFFGRFLIGGKALCASDVLYGLSPWEALADPDHDRPRNKILGETVLQLAPWRDLVVREYRAGRLPLWNPYSFAGTPLLANSQSAAFDPIRFLELAFTPPEGRLPVAMIRLFLSGIFAFLLLRRWTVAPFPALLGAAAWMLNGWVLNWLLWPLGPSMTYLTPILFFTDLIARARSSGGLIGLAVSVCFLLLTGHPETAYFVMSFAGVIGLLLAFSRFGTGEGGRQTRGQTGLLVLLLFAAGSLLGVLLGAIHVVPFLEYLGESAALAFRSDREPRFDSTVPLRFRLPSFLVPQIFGTTYADDYWGPWNRNASMFYPSAAALFLLPLGLRRRETRPLAVLLLTVGLFMALAAAKVPGFVQAIHALPGFGLATESRLPVFWIFGVIVLAALGWEALEKEFLIPRRALSGLLWGWLGILLALAAASYAIVAPLFASEEARSLAIRETLIACGLLGAIPLLVGLRAVRRVPVGVLRAGAFALLIGDLIRISLFGLTASDPEDYYPPLETVARLRARDDSVFRVAPVGKALLAGNSCLEYDLMDVRGNDALTILRYEELYRRIDPAARIGKKYKPRRRQLLKRYFKTGDEALLGSFRDPFLVLRLRERYRRTLEEGRDPAELLASEGPKTRVLDLPDVKSHLLDLLNAKYVLLPRNVSPDRIAGLRPPRFEPLFTAECRVFENTRAFPRAFAVAGVRVAGDDAEALDLLDGGEVDLRRTAIVVGVDPLAGNEPAGSPEAGSVDIRTYETQEVVLDAAIDVEQALVILSDAYFPGWRASVDGREATIHRVNHVLRGVVVPEGSHEIRFVYRPASIRVGALLSGVALVGILLIAVRAGLRGRRRGSGPRDGRRESGASGPLRSG